MNKAEKPMQKSSKKVNAPALTNESRENRLIALAMDAAEQQMLDGTASSQVITHFLKLGTVQAQLETKKLECENNLLKAKEQALKANASSEEMYSAAIEAMKKYSGASDD